MRSLLSILFILLPGAVLAEAFDRPVPAAQSATAEFWFALASLSFLVAMVAVHLMVRRKP